MKVVKIASVFIIVILAAAAAFSYWIFRSVQTPVEHARAAEYIRIEKGSTPSQIVSQLSAAGVIANEMAANIYLRTVGETEKLQAGDFRFPSPISTVQVFRLLEKGEERATMKIVVPEGFTRFDIAKRIAEWSVNRADTSTRPTAEWEQERILKLLEDTTLVRDLAPEAKSLEGYLYPSTYLLDAASTPEKVIKTMVDQFRRFWKPEWSQRARSIGRTPHEIVTIASLVETETSVESERPTVAGVINNRLAKNIPLGIDQTNVYIAKMLGRWDGTIHKSDLEVDSPYNTRKKTGLPPGPISSVTESSIRAALHPQPNDYIFYVRNVDLNDGSHWFYASAAEFEKGKAKYQVWLAKERDAIRNAETNPAP